MKTNLTITLALASTLAFVACDKTSEEAVSTSAETYPLEVCVVSGEPLDSMGGEVEIQHEGTTVKFCCKSCIDDFNAEPATYLAKLENPGAAQE